MNSRESNSGRKPELDEKELEAIKGLVEKRPDITIEEIIEGLCLPLHKSEVSNIPRNRFNFRYKKTMSASEQKRPDVKEKRKNWKEEQPAMPTGSLVFLDESGTNINMTRHYGRAPGKSRVQDNAPLNTPRTTTILSSIRMDGKMVKEVFPGALKGPHFVDYITNNLAPTLQKGDTVIMDNLRCHKMDGVRKAIEGSGAELVYLPPYSPDLNPIEMLWSKKKTILRKMKPRSLDTLYDVKAGYFRVVSGSWLFYCLSLLEML